MAVRTGAEGPAGGTRKKNDDKDKLISELKKENLILHEKLQSSKEELEVRAEELEAQLEELRVNNEELERQIEERRRAEEAVKKSRFILAKSQEMAHVGNWAWNVRTGKMNGSDEAYRIYGHAPGEVCPDIGWAMAGVHPDDKALMAGFADAVAREGARTTIDHRIVKPDGTIRHVSTTADKVVRDAAGNVKWVYGITQDITERKLAEEEISRLASIVMSSDDAIIGKTLDGIITSWNRGAELLYGYSGAEALGKHIDIVVPPGRRQELKDILEEIRRGGRIEHYDTARITKDGRIIDMSVSISPIIDAAGRVIGASTIARDVTERKRADKALQEKQEELEVQAEELRVNNEELERQIEERHRAEVRLIEKKRQLSEAQALAHTGNWERDLVTGDVVFSDEMLRILGLPPGRHTYDEFRDRVHPEDRAYRDAAIEDSIARHTQYAADYRIIRADGVRDVHAVGGAYLDASGKPCRFLSTVQDVTERKRAEAALRESEARIKVAEAVEAERHRFNDVLETLPAYLILLTPDYHVPFANRFFRERFGESHGRRCYEYLFGRTEPCENCETYKVLKTGDPHHWEWTGPDGRNYDIYDYPFKDTDGSPMIMEMGIDITERKRAETALRELNETLEQRVVMRTEELQEKQEELSAQAEELEAQTEELRANNDELEGQILERQKVEEALRETSDYLEGLVKYANAPIIVWGPDFRITRFNHAFERLTGYKANQMIGRKLEILFPQESREESLAKIERTLTGEYWESVEIPILMKSGGTRIALWNSANIYDRQDGNVLMATIAQGQDITERKLAEEELVEAKTQAELYLDLMGHDISNMHQIALSQLEMAQETLAEEGRLAGEDKELVDTPIKTLERSAQLIDNVRKLQKLRAGEYKSEAMDLGALLGDVVKEHSGVPGSNVRINYNPMSGYYVNANPLLKDVFTNLVGNAIKHSSGHATINVGLASALLDGSIGYMVTIEDDGQGIPDDKKEEIFHRFKRGQTKARGTGLGLYIVKTLVDSFHGKVWVEDRVPGDYTKGSRFVVLLPAAEKGPMSGIEEGGHGR